MGYQREFRPLLFVALSVLCFVLPGQSVSTPPNGVVWFSDHKTLKAIDTETNALARVLDVAEKPDALAVDPAADVVWILRGKRLTKFSDTGVELLQIDLNKLEPGFGAAKLLKINPYRGSLWVAANKTLLQVSSTGELVARWSASKNIDALAIDADETLWIVAHRELVHLSANATPLSSVDLSQDLNKAEQLIVDGLGGVIWIADKKRLLRLNLSPVSDAPKIVSAPELEEENDPVQGNNDVSKIRALEVHPVLGTLWVATKNSLLMFNRDGGLAKTVALPSAVGDAKAIAFDLASASLWVAGKNGVARFTGSGELVALVPAEKEAEHVAAGDFTLFPTVSILEPLDGSLTNNPRTRVRLALGSTCSGTPCLLPDAYTRSLNLDVTLNGDSIGSQFDIGGSEGIYLPAAPLPEGSNALVARGTDLFGHRSNDAMVQFVVDTIPPKFVSISPPDGSTVNNAALVISGEVDDPTANVTLADGSGNGISISNANFSFSVLLKAGLNTFALTARDPAGNGTTIPLRISYNAVSVKITSPVIGATLTSRGAIVSGDFMGPPNTGITVNGVVAQVFGSHFFANLALPPGPNTLTAVATTPSGASVTDSVTVTVNAPAIEPATITIEPQSGIAPLNVRISAGSNTAQSVTELRVDANGDGTSEIVKSNPIDPVEYVYASPGVYQTKITAIDAAGAVTEQTVAIVVSDGQQMDQFFTALWGGMNDALARGDIATAVSFLNDAAKRKYQPVFEVLRPHFPEIIASYSPLSRVSVSADIGEYIVVRPDNGQNRLYFIYFLKDIDGVWRVDAM